MLEPAIRDKALVYNPHLKFHEVSMSAVATTSEPRQHTGGTIATGVASIVALLAFLYCGYIAVRYSGQHMLIRNFSFRQTQTALTAYWACRDGFKLAYETPVGGVPWAIPFEFPIYQWIVSWISCSFGFDLERVGRLVSYAFLAACVFPIARLSRNLFLGQWPLYFLATTALFFSAPLHIFFSNAFLMESAALFFSLYFVSYSISMIQGDRSVRTGILAGTFLTLAILQKSTTALPLVPVFGLWMLCGAAPEIRAQGLKSRALWLGIIAILVPFVVGTAWAKYSDIVKELNLFGHHLTSSALMKWNFGGDRLDWKLWLWVIWHRNIVTNIGGWLGIGILVAGLVTLDRKHRGLIVLSAVLFLMYFMIFTNLQYVHEYYQISNEAFLLFAVAIALAGAMQHSNKLLSTAGVVALIAVVAVNFQTFRTSQNFKWLQEVHGPNDPVLASAHFVRDNTDGSKPIIVFGDEWNSEFPFYSERKAFVVPKFFPQYDDVYQNPAKYVGVQPSAVMVCRDDRTPDFESRISAAIRPRSINKLELCDIFLK
ncbi:hypothetical protein WJ60_29195 [Burkholderia ubonensis]|uniref:hypothetical protein n=1 Tax=Burkholderia ubonensis TaxID=101571 RepID=UPI00075703F7|nr:hypothetical protein [Burkholderia ubonensis]KVM78728.1 hypothetical protein WJ60_29195 [Burkholderia ubonensis]